MRTAAFVLTVLVALSAAAPGVHAQAAYRFTFPEPHHHWMQVEIAFEGIGEAPLALRMSQSSPGRYAVHDFAKNVYDVRAAAAGRELPVTRADPHGWVVADHGGAATISYKVFGDRLDGTYLAIDPTHAHINMPAAVMWARGFEHRPIAVRFEPPPGRAWQVATQLFPGRSPFDFTAPNLQYLMDSPAEFGPGVLRELTVGDARIRVALHHTGSAPDVDAFLQDVRKIVGEQREIFGEFPAYEPGHYTFIADYLPHAEADAMEHRNSTVLTGPMALGTGRHTLLAGVAHEFFHGWNVERIRPRSLEPFDFERANMSAELWLAEGFTEYYAALTMARARLLDADALAGELQAFVASVALNPARLVRSAEEMSRMAVFTDLGRPADPTNWPRTVISYYQFGGAIALALDLTLRARSGGRVTLDDYMRAMWRAHGRPGGQRPGYVDRSYSAADAEARLAEVAADAGFARDFFARFVQGHELPDYRGLLEHAGFVLRKSAAGRAWIGDVRLDDRAGVVRVASPPPFTSPAYAAELDVDDAIRQLDGDRIGSFSDISAILARHRPGDRIEVVFVDRTGAERTTTMTLGEDPALELVPVERTGRSPTAAQRAFREGWLN